MNPALILKGLFQLPRFYSRLLSIGLGVFAAFCLVVLVSATLFQSAKPVDPSSVWILVIAIPFSGFASFAFWTQRSMALCVTVVMLMVGSYVIPALGLILSWIIF